MGVQLGDIVEAKKIAIEDLAGRTVAFDGNNILYQFLSIIRGRDGQPLRDREGRVTSHLSGLIYRNSNLAEAGIKIAYVFDGKPHSFKRQVLQQRRQVREKAKKKYEKAVKEGDPITARRYGQQAIVATTDIIQDAKTLLTHMGIPWVQAPGEGEAQTAYMAQKGDVWGAASQDFDSLLFGAPRHIRNLSVTGRRKLPRKNVYIKIEPEILELNKIMSDLELTRSQLIDMGILIGTDYNPKGIKGIGPKTALKLIKTHGTIEAALPHIKNPEFPHPLDEIKELFHNPRTTDDYQLEWKKPDTASVIGFLCGEHNFNQTRVMNALEKLNKGFTKTGQRTTLDRFFG
ncbi:MAG: flap endonuclease-1 [Candidatus Bathyarchaeota archaeon]|nr:flap endonuclease-1 [Candidatus Bathyarchaeota archaeon]